MTNNYDFVFKKVQELEFEFPFINAYVKWSGNIPVDQFDTNPMEQL